MYRSLILGLALAVVLCGPVTAQDAQKQAPKQPDGRSLVDPDHQRRANDSMNTASGRAGRDEPSAHTPTTNDPLVLKDGKLTAPGTPTQSTPAPGGTSGERR